jgi:pimeloyl-ACP methyl ester carboxylesterase
VSARLSRRQIGLASAGIALGGCGACGERRERGMSSAAPVVEVGADAGAMAPRTWTEVAWSEREAPPEGQAALVFRGADDPEAPLVIALHGRGEAGRGLGAGARGWRDDYDVERVDARLRAGRLAKEDLGGFATEARLAELNGSLARDAYRGVVLVTPYSPITSGARDGAAPFVRFLDEQAIPRAARLMGRDPASVRCGIDGVSMGGRLALWAAILRPRRFASVGALQPAIAVADAAAFAEQLAQARQESPFALRLVSSEEDPFLDAVRALGAALGGRGVEHRVIVTPGPHDYAWNRGPGAAELLLHHERVLRGLPPP